MTAQRPLTLRSISHAFSDRYVLRKVDLEVASGEVVLLRGANGAGKSTLLRIASTFLVPLSGEVLLFGYTIEEARQKVRKRIGALFHDSFLAPELTVGENLRLYARLYELADIDRRIDALLDVFHIRDFRQERVRTLSRGERQRTSLARSLLADPLLCLWDEPGNGLDPAGKQILGEVIASRKGRTSFVCVSHENPHETWGDRVLTLRDGRVE